MAVERSSTPVEDTEPLGVDMMKAVVLRDFGGPDVLEPTAVPKPTPGRAEVVIRVGAAFVAPTRDVAIRGGRVIPGLEVTPPQILGGEHAGTVVAVGSEVSDGLVGARVAVCSPVSCGECDGCQAGRPWQCSRWSLIGIHRQGSNAEFSVVPAENLEILPNNMSFVQAALLAANGPLAYSQVKALAIAPGESTLVLGASGSLGSIGVALAARAGARVIATTRRDSAREALGELGASWILDTSSANLGDAIRERGISGVDTVVDNLALIDLWNRYWPAIARSGRVVISGRVGDWGQPLPINVIELYQRRISVCGRALGDRRDVSGFWAEMRKEPISVPADLVTAFPLDQAARAHEQIEAGSKVGHYVLTGS